MEFPLTVQQTYTVLGDFQLFRYDFLEVFHGIFTLDEYGKAAARCGRDVQRHGAGR